MAAPRLVLFAHGSQDPRWRAPFEKLLQSLAEELGTGRVRLAYMEFCAPSLLHIAAEAQLDGVREISLLPLFLAAGAHVARDIPAQVEEAEHRYPGVRFRVLPPIGENPRVTRLLRELAIEAAP
jgi:sirohydrochlorin cobaltochelatase